MESSIFGKFGGEVPQTFLAAIQSHANFRPKRQRMPKLHRVRTFTFTEGGAPHPKLLNPRKRNFLLKHQPAQPHLGAGCEGGFALSDTTRQRVQVLGKYL